MTTIESSPHGVTGPDGVTRRTPDQARRPGSRFFGVLARPQSYRNLAYLLLGLPLGTIWFSAVVTAVAVDVSLLVVALIGLPLLVLTWYMVRLFANVERGVAGLLRAGAVPFAPVHGPTGNLWVRLRTMSGDRRRWRELAFLLLRFPVGIATFTAAVVSVSTPFAVAAAPLTARLDHTDPFGRWRDASEVHDVASSPWGWLLLPAGVVLLVAAIHLLDGLAGVCGRWAWSWLGPIDEPSAAAPTTRTQAVTVDGR